MLAQIPKGNVKLDYMGHADCTLALIDIDPTFSYGWVTNEKGLMAIEIRGDRLIIEGWLVLHGVRREGVGTCAKSKGEPEKELIGDLLRNCAMRFGVATALWSKADRHELGIEQPPQQAQQSRPAPQPERRPAESTERPAAPSTEPAKNDAPVDISLEAIKVLYDRVEKLSSDNKQRVDEKVKSRGLSWSAADNWKVSSLGVITAFVASLEPK